MVENISMGQRLRRIREKRGLTKYRLSKLSGVTEAYLSHLEGGAIANPRRDTMLALAKGLGVSLAELAGEELLTPANAWSIVETSLKAFIPVYGEVSAGSGMDPIDYVAVTRAKPAPESLRAYRVKGLCLEPEVRDGDTLIVDTALTPDPGDLVVVIMEGQASVKRFRGDHLENNGGSYRPEDVTLHGVVVEVSRRLR